MAREGTKEAAEAVLRELPSVIGAFVREDVNGHPREVHVLVRPGPNTRHLAYDVRDLLEERLGVPVDQRVISIAQLAPGRIPGPILSQKAGIGKHAPPEAEPGPEPETEPAPEPVDTRVRFSEVSVQSINSRASVTVVLDLAGREIAAEAVGLDTLAGRLRTAASATLHAVDVTCVGRARFEIEHASIVHAFERDYVLITALVSSPFLGRRPIQLVGAQPIELDPESAAVLATLKAVNRILSLVLRIAEGSRPGPPLRQRH